MTKEQAAKTIPVMLAWINGKECQWRVREDGQWDPCDSENESFSHANPNYEYRIKPEPKLRPWKPEEVPVGNMLRKRYCWPARGIILGACQSCLFYCTVRGVENVSYSEIEAKHNNFEHSTDGGKTWLPCGIIES